MDALPGTATPGRPGREDPPVTPASDLPTRTWERLVRSERNWLRLPERRAGLGRVADFLADLEAGGDVLFHGSNSRTLELLEPRDQTTFHGTRVRAVFATPDPVWPLFFAVTATEIVGSRWNMCALPDRPGRRTRYYFSLGTPRADFWTGGAVYVFDRAAFEPSDEPSEWIAREAVRPVAVVSVRPEDFPFRDRVFTHRAGEPE
jgi:hypothetical protein